MRAVLDGLRVLRFVSSLLGRYRAARAFSVVVAVLGAVYYAGRAGGAWA